MSSSTHAFDHPSKLPFHLRCIERSQTSNRGRSLEHLQGYRGQRPPSGGRDHVSTQLKHVNFHACFYDAFCKWSIFGLSAPMGYVALHIGLQGERSCEDLEGQSHVLGTKVQPCQGLVRLQEPGCGVWHCEMGDVVLGDSEATVPGIAAAVGGRWVDEMIDLRSR